RWRARPSWNLSLATFRRRHRAWTPSFATTSAWRTEPSMQTAALRLGLRENLGQFSLLVLVNAFVGAMVGLERSIVPAIAEHEFHIAARGAILSFIVVFGITKALTNYLAGRLSDRFGRKHVLVAGWLVAAPVPFLFMWSPTWSWLLFANALRCV